MGREVFQWTPTASLSHRTSGVLAGMGQILAQGGEATKASGGGGRADRLQVSACLLR